MAHQASKQGLKFLKKVITSPVHNIPEMGGAMKEGSRWMHSSTASRLCPGGVIGCTGVSRAGRSCPPGASCPNGNKFCSGVNPTECPKLRGAMRVVYNHQHLHAIPFIPTCVVMCVAGGVTLAVAAAKCSEHVPPQDALCTPMANSI